MALALCSVRVWWAGLQACVGELARGSWAGRAGPSLRARSLSVHACTPFVAHARVIFINQIGSRKHFRIGLPCSHLLLPLRCGAFSSPGPGFGFGCCCCHPRPAAPAIPRRPSVSISLPAALLCTSVCRSLHARQACAALARLRVSLLPLLPVCVLSPLCYALCYRCRVVAAPAARPVCLSNAVHTSILYLSLPLARHAPCYPPPHTQHHGPLGGSYTPHTSHLEAMSSNSAHGRPTRPC